MHQKTKLCKLKNAAGKHPGPMMPSTADRVPFIINPVTAGELDLRTSVKVERQKLRIT